MDYLRRALDAVFHIQEVDDVIYGLLSGNDEYNLETGISETSLQKLMLRIGVHDTLDQLSIVNYLLNGKWIKEDDEIKSLVFSKRETMFNALLHFSHQTLHVHDGDPICRYEELLRWHSLTQFLGEDLFVCSFLASHNLKTGEQRTAFDWEPYLNHDSNELNALLHKPISDLHSHLYGSSINFELNWMALMNNISDRQNVFSDLSKYPVYRKQENTNEKYSQAIIAARIRYYLFMKYLRNDASHYWSVLEDISFYRNKSKRQQIISRVYDLQNCINSISNENLLDYADNASSKLFYKELAGERRILYEMFHHIYGDNDKDNEAGETKDWELLGHLHKPVFIQRYWRV